MAGAFLFFPQPRHVITPLEEALAAVRGRARPLAAEDVPLAEAYGRVLAEGVRARRDQPATDISMMDGYALRAADAQAALRVAGEIAAGDALWSRPLQPGEATRIFTGAPLPPAADCVVMQEYAVRDGTSLRIEQPPKPGQHIRRRGEELTAGAEALAAGRVLDASDLALAAACGAASVRAHRRPRVAVLCTGSELVPVGEDPPPGKIVETNSLTLSALCRDAGAEVVRLGVVEDAVERIAEKLRDAPADILLTTGGASVGDHDHAQEALERLGGKLIFHTVAIRPGKPILLERPRAQGWCSGSPGTPPRRRWDSSSSSAWRSGCSPEILILRGRGPAPGCAERSPR